MNEEEKENLRKERWRQFYSDSKNLIEFYLENGTDSAKLIWVEPAAFSIEMEPMSGYKLFTHDKSFAIKFASDSQITFWTNLTFGFLLFKACKQHNGKVEWELDFDCTDIQFGEPDLK